MSGVASGLFGCLNSSISDHKTDLVLCASWAEMTKGQLISSPGIKQIKLGSKLGATPTVWLKLLARFHSLAIFKNKNLLKKEEVCNSLAISHLQIASAHGWLYMAT